MSPAFVARPAMTVGAPRRSVISHRAGLRVVAACAPPQAVVKARPAVPNFPPLPAASDVEAFMARARAVTVTASCAIAIALAWECDAAIAGVELGKQIFNGNCAACHQGGRNVVISEKTLDKAALEQYLDGGFNLEAIIYQVENGKGAMPAWDDRLSAEEIQSVAEYVYQTASAGAWDGQ